MRVKCDSCAADYDEQWRGTTCSACDGIIGGNPEPFKALVAELRNCEHPDDLVTRGSAYSVCADKIEIALAAWESKLKSVKNLARYLLSEQNFTENGIADLARTLQKATEDWVQKAKVDRAK